MSRRSIFRWLALPPLLAAASPVVAAPLCLTGTYNGSAMEMAAQIELKADKSFSYALSYGALDEEAEGRWESDGTSVFLTGNPVTPPRFSLVSQGPGTGGQFAIAVDVPRGMNPQYLDAVLMFADGHGAGQQMGDDGLIVPLKPGEKVVGVRLLLAVYDLQSELFSVSGNAARFRFEANDLGKVAFTHTPLKIDGRDLLLTRYDREIRFRHGEGCGN